MYTTYTQVIIYIPAKFERDLTKNEREIRRHSWWVGWFVGCCLTSHSAIFQLYSDGTVVQIPNLDLLLGTQRHGQLGVFSVPSLPRQSEDVFYLLDIRGEGKPGIEPGSPDPQSSPLPLRHCLATDGGKEEK